MAFDLRLTLAMRDGPPPAEHRQTESVRISPRLFAFLLAAILCLAALLRFYHLDAQSLWNDEGNSARIAERSLDLIVEGAAGDIHPPGYYLLLHAWRAVFGQSEFALRALSAVAGLVMVAFTALLGRCLWSPLGGLLAAALSAVSPFAIYYAQEARMYALLGALAAASTYVTIRTLNAVEVGLEMPAGDGVRAARLLWPAAYTLVNAAGLYTHYAFLFVLIAHNVVFGLRWLGSLLRHEWRWRGLVVWAAANAGAGLFYLPWLPTALGATGWSSAGGGYEIGAALLSVARVLAVGVTQRSGEARMAMVFGIGLLTAGAWPGGRRDGRGEARLSGWWATASIGVYLFTPLALFFAFDLYKPAWLKFLVVLLPAYHLLVAQGMRNVAVLASHAWRRRAPGRRIAWLAVCGLLIVAWGGLAYPSLRNLYFDPAYARDDYRQLAADLRDMRRLGDAIVLNAPNQWEVFTYYYPDRDVYPAPYKPAPGEASAFLAPLQDAYERLFVLYWGDAESDPTKRVESWLAQHAYKAGDRWYGDVRLATYGLAALPQAPDVTLNVTFGEDIGLQGYALSDASCAPGDIVPVTLFWEARGALETSFKVSVQILDGEGQLVSQMDTIPGNGLAPTMTWRKGGSLTDRYGVWVPGDVSGGRYSLIVAVYRAASGKRLPVFVDGDRRGDHLPLGDVTVRKAAD